MLSAMPSRRQSPAIGVSPRGPSRIMRIFSSAEYCFRVARRMGGQASRTSPGWSWIYVSSSLLGGYDEPEILRSSSR